MWGEALERVAEGLAAGRRWLWDEAARRVGILLAAPAAFEGEHFLQARTSPAAKLARLNSRRTLHMTFFRFATGILFLILLEMACHHNIILHCLPVHGDKVMM